MKVLLSSLHRILMVLPVLAITTGTAIASDNEWFQRMKDEFPSDRYINGSGIYSGSKTDVASRNKAIEYAKKELVESIRTSIKSEAISTSKRTATFAGSNFVAEVRSLSDIKDLEGLESEQEYDSDAKAWMSFAHLDRKKAINGYSAKITRIRSEITELRNKGESERDDKNSVQALQDFQACRIKLQELVELKWFLVSFVGSFDTADKLINFDNDNIERQLITIFIDEMMAYEIVEMDDFADYIVNSLRCSPKAGTGISILIEPIVPNGQEYICGSAEQLRKKIENRIINLPDWKVSASSSKNINGSEYITDTRRKESGASHVLVGSYAVFENSVEFEFRLKSIISNEIDAQVPKTIMLELFNKWKFDLQPNNADRIADLQGGNDTQEPSLMNLIVWTNQGDQKVIFREGEAMQVFARVNFPAYLRVIYCQANGKMLLITDVKTGKDYYIPTDSVEKDIMLMNIACSEPFGAELIQVFASKTEFPEWHGQPYKQATELPSNIMTQIRELRNTSAAVRGQIVLTSVSAE